MMVTLNGNFGCELTIPTTPLSFKRYMMVDITKLPSGIPMSVNPRSQNMGSKAVKAMEKSLEDRNPDFPLMNGGIKIICKSIKAIGGHSLVLNIDDEKTQGIIDGGHTYRTITEFIASHPKYKPGVCVFIELMYGTHPVDICVDIAAARNTSSQVKLISIMNAQGKFEEVKQVLSDLPFSDDIIWEENQSGRIKGEFIMALMQLFNTFQLSKTGTQPCDAYNSFDNCLKAFDRAYVANNGITEKNPFYYIIPLLPDLLKLHDYVHQSIARWYSSNDGCNFGSLKSDDETYASLSKNKKFKTFLFEQELRMYTPQMMVFPILTVARYCLEVKNKQMRWKIDPHNYLDVVGPAATKVLIKGMMDYKDRHKYMKLPTTWSTVYNTARDAWEDSKKTVEEDDINTIINLG